jgi:outer membrane protein assembly factor BamE (lipoprotein component of BamABCDE complex)
MNSSKIKLWSARVLVAALAMEVVGCGAPFHSKEVRTGQDADRLTVGTVQREIRKGMSGAEVLEALGSPNVVSTDESGLEVWVYDRFATDVVASESVGTLILLSGSSGAASRTQRTLTVIIKFDENKRVRDFAYHSSRF